jgi:hypothetical protein
MSFYWRSRRAFWGVFVVVIFGQLQVHFAIDTREAMIPILPFWVIVICYATLMARERKRLGRFCASQCSASGYDLTGNTSGVCPEWAWPLQANA